MARCIVKFFNTPITGCVITSQVVLCKVAVALSSEIGCHSLVLTRCIGRLIWQLQYRTIVPSGEFLPSITYCSLENGVGRTCNFVGILLTHIPFVFGNCSFEVRLKVTNVGRT